MNKISLNNLIKTSLDESAPVVSVADDVIFELSKAKSETLISYKPLAWIASASTAMAAGIAIAAFILISNSSGGAMSDLYQTISWVAQ